MVDWALKINQQLTNLPTCVVCRESTTDSLRRQKRAGEDGPLHLTDRTAGVAGGRTATAEG